jgi:uncharacterized protein (TIGR03435 family)
MNPVRSRRAHVLALALCAVAAVVVTAVHAQAPTAFDVASVKVNRSGFPGGMMDSRPGQFTATNETLRLLLTAAYGLETFRIVGGPDWIDSDRFDVQARASSPVPRAEAMAMLRTLLADRFALRARVERRERPVFNLVLSRDDGRTGARLRPASPEACVDRGPQPGSVPRGELPSCGLLPAGPGRMSGRSVSLDLLATQLSSRVSRVVIDRTGLTGLFDLDLEWAVDEAQRAALARLSPDGAVAPADPDRPGLVGALSEQLGVRLESTTGMVDVLVVESAERPSEN